MADVVKGKWYPAPAPGFDEESDDTYTTRMLDKERNPYDHQRFRQCSIGYHRECSERSVSGLANAFTDNKFSYTGECECPCHTDYSPFVNDELLGDAAETLAELYDLPTPSAWHVLHVADIHAADFVERTTVDTLATAIGREYGSEVGSGFAIDVAHILANKGPVGAVRAFWKGVYTRRALPAAEKDPPPSGNPALTEAMRLLANDLGKDVFVHPSEMANTPREDLGGMQIVYRGDLPLGTGFFVHPDGRPAAMFDASGRVTSVGDETLDEAIARVCAATPPPLREINRQITLAQTEQFRMPNVDHSAPWLLAGVELIHRLHSAVFAMNPQEVENMWWLLPPEIGGSGTGMLATLHGLRVRVIPGVMPHLAFKLGDA